jgi:hypothetical protein
LQKQMIIESLLMSCLMSWITLAFLNLENTKRRKQW